MMALKVLKKELNENLRKKRIILSAAFLGILGACLLLSNADSIEGTAASDRGVFVLLMVPAYPVLLSLLSVAFNVHDTVFVEKVKKGCENLLATPLSVKDLVIGKSLFSFVLVYPLTLLVMLIFLLDLSIKNVPCPAVYTIVDLALLLPVTIFALSVIIVSATLQYRSGQQILAALQMAIILSFMGFLFALPSYIIPFIVSSGLQLPLETVFLMPFLALAIVLAALACLMVRYADREKIVLTG